MPNAFFHFKQFSVRHDRCAVKVGTDALLLGGWTDFKGAQRILDIGTGCGVLALIAAQRNPSARIDAIEIDDAAAEQAGENFAASPWPGRLRAHRMDVRRLRTSERYDLIISNPPYYEGEMASPDDRHNVARHGGGLSLNELVETSVDLLTEEGRLSVIIPIAREKDLLSAASALGLQLRRRCEVQYVEGRTAKRLLLELGRTALEVINENVTVADRHGNYATAYRGLLNDLKEF